MYLVCTSIVWLRSWAHLKITFCSCLHLQPALYITIRMPIILPHEVDGVQPWDTDRKLVKDLVAKKGGVWVVTAARLDYLNLTDIMMPRRFAGRSDTLPAARFAYLDQDMDLDRRYEVLIRSVAKEGRLVGDQVPASQREGAALLAQEFSHQSVGHVAVEAMAWHLQALAEAA